MLASESFVLYPSFKIKTFCMRWELASADANHEVYHLYKNEKKILTLLLNPFSRTARVECDNEKRNFQIRKEGFLRNKTIIRNEYGVRVGELGHENKQDFIDINGEKFFYTVSDKEKAELVLYKQSEQQPLVSCGLSTKEGDTSIHFTKDKEQLESAPHPGLLMALCWYMFLPVAKDNLVGLIP